MTRNPSHPNSTVLVVDWNSYCNNCGKQTLPGKSHHTEVSGYRNGGPGCGIKFTHITADASMRIIGGIADTDRRVQECNPNLELIPLQLSGIGFPD